MKKTFCVLMAMFFHGYCLAMDSALHAKPKTTCAANTNPLLVCDAFPLRRAAMHLPFDDIISLACASKEHLNVLKDEKSLRECVMPALFAYLFSVVPASRFFKLRSSFSYRVVNTWLDHYARVLKAKKTIDGDDAYIGGKLSYIVTMRQELKKRSFESLIEREPLKIQNAFIKGWRDAADEERDCHVLKVFPDWGKCFKRHNHELGPTITKQRKNLYKNYEQLWDIGTSKDFKAFLHKEVKSGRYFVNYWDIKDGRTLFELAVLAGNYQKASLLVDCMTDDELIEGNSRQETPLALVLRSLRFAFDYEYHKYSGLEKLARKLIERLKSDQLNGMIQANTWWHSTPKTPLSFVIPLSDSLSLAMIEKLSTYQLGFRDSDGYTALHYAIEGRKVAIARKLIEKMSPVHLLLTTNTGCTPLHFASLVRSSRDIFSPLLAKTPAEGFSIKNRDSLTVLRILLEWRVRGYLFNGSALERRKYDRYFFRLADKMSTHDLKVRAPSCRSIDEIARSQGLRGLAKFIEHRIPLALFSKLRLVLEGRALIKGDVEGARKLAEVLKKYQSSTAGV